MGSIAGGHEPGGGSLDLRCSSRPLLLIIPRDRSNSSAVDARGQRREREGSPPPSRARCQRRRRAVAATRHGSGSARQVGGDCRAWRSSALVRRRAEGAHDRSLGPGLSTACSLSESQHQATATPTHGRESNTFIHLIHITYTQTCLAK
jgi:hypothetical protein